MKRRMEKDGGKNESNCIKNTKSLRNGPNCERLIYILDRSDGEFTANTSVTMWENLAMGCVVAVGREEEVVGREEEEEKEGANCRE